MKRILEVFGEPVSYGGQEAFFFNVLRHMDTSDLRIDVFTPYYCDNETSRTLVQQYGGELMEAGLSFEPGKSRANICKPLAACLQKNDYDAMHIHSGSTSVLALAALTARRNGIKKIIVHSHCTGVSKNLKYRLTKLAMTPVLDVCPTHYCACSMEAGAWKYSRRSMKKLIILKNGIDLEKFAYSPEIRHRMRDQLGLKQDDFVIGHVGRFSFQKNQEFIIELLARVRESIPDAKAVFVGDGETLLQIKELADERNVSQNVRFTGNVDNVQDYLQAMDIFAFPSRFEGLGIVGVEAQANGLAVLASTNIPQELRLSPLVKFIDLNDMQQWVRETAAMKNKQRMNVREDLAKAGYDIRETASLLQKIYQNDHI